MVCENYDFTNWSLDKMVNIMQMIFPNYFLWQKIRTGRESVVTVHFIVLGFVLVTWLDLGLLLNSAWISNYTHYKVWDDITYPFPSFNVCTVEVWEWISNFIPHFTGHVITYPCWDYSQGASSLWEDKPVNNKETNGLPISPSLSIIACLINSLRLNSACMGQQNNHYWFR